MNCLLRPSLIVLLLVPLFSRNLVAQHASPPQTLNTPRTFPEIKTRAEWKRRAAEIREQILVTCGLWPLPEKNPLHPQIFGKITRDGYSVEKVYFQTYPGFYLAGNLYRPAGKGPGPFPGVLNPHGHWANGRMADTTDGSIAARCISFARQGMVAFSYDMVGYNDTRFPDWPADGKFSDLHWQFATNRSDQLWSINLMGLQTWNSIRALDFLASLPGVDKKRLACTGESGGGTQTYILGAVDDRLAVQAPVVMVSSTMQGGCLCENAPGLRIEYSNMEIAAAAAPRPQILVSATGDWTKKTLEVEGPALESVYRLFDATDRLRYVRFNFNHNYNQTSREAVYEWFGQWLLKHLEAALLKEQPYQKEPDADLRVFPDGKLPADALTMDKFVESRKQEQREQWQKLMPQNPASFKKFKSVMLPAWRHTMQVAWPEPFGDDARVALGSIGKRVIGTVPVQKTVVIVVRENLNHREPTLKTEGIMQRENVTWVYLPSLPSVSSSDEFSQFFTTYNRTELQEQTRRLVATCAALRERAKVERVVLVGFGRAGLWALLAAPAADAVVADCAGLDVAADEELLETGLFVPGLRRIGTFEGAAMLAAPHPLLLHNAGSKFSTSGIQSTYQALDARKKLRVESRALTEDEVLEWVSGP